MIAAARVLIERFRMEADIEEEKKLIFNDSEGCPLSEEKRNFGECYSCPYANRGRLYFPLGCGKINEGEENEQS